MAAIPVEGNVLESYLRSEHIGQADRESDPQVREYWQRGYIALRGMFTRDEIAEWNRECDRLLKSDYVFPENIRSPFRMNSGDRPERIDPVVDISEVFRKVTQDARIVDVVSKIFRDKPMLFKDKLIFKAPGTDGYTPHQDQAYWQLCPADDILSVSIQIDGANAANGCIELFPGYHDHLMTPPKQRMQLREEDMAKIDASKGEKIETQPGDVLIFHSLAPHGSAKNTDTTSRKSLYLTYSASRNGDFYLRQLQNYIAYNFGGKTTQYK